MADIEQQRLLDTFLDLVRINSESGNERGVADYLRPRLIELGAAVSEDTAGDVCRGNSGNLTALLPGDERRPALLLSAHMDVVKPGNDVAPVLREGYVCSDGTTVLGADDKAGIAIILEALRTVPASERPPLDVVFTIGEEVGLYGAKALDPSPLRAEYGYILDDAGPLGKVTVAAPTHNLYRVEVTGRAAHAGMAPEEGINAIQALAGAITRFPQGRLADDTTANIGTIGGGTAQNIVAASAWVEGEVRSHREDELERQTERIREVMAAVAAETGITYNATVNRQYRSFRVSEDNPLLATLRQINPGAVTTAISNGGSDANILNEKGIATVVLGIGYEKIHTVEERIAIDELNGTARLVADILRRWGR